MKKLLLFSFSFIAAIVSAQVPKIQLVNFALGLTKPVDLKHCTDSRLFVVEQNGIIKIIRSDGSVMATPFMNITPKVNAVGNEQGLLAMAFSPSYKTDGYFFVNYTKGTGAGSSVVSRFSVNPLDSNRADTATEFILLQFTQPYTNHNGCDMRFGPDGYLYISFGDGGSGGDPQAYGQNTNTYLGKTLRIDPFGGTPYAIPTTNPFYGQAGKKEEIWAYGLRNPWRCSFDRLTGDYWIGDVGQNVYEEIDFQPASSLGGENYGWRCYEGNSTFNMSGCSTNPADFVYPVYEYAHSGPAGCSVTGGIVYRGPQYQNMFGKYIFADYCSGRIWSIDKVGAAFNTSVVGNYTTYQYSSFGENYLGDLFVTGLGAGRVYRVTDTSSCKPVAFLGFSDTIFACDSSSTLSTLQGTGLTYAWSLNSVTIPTATGFSHNATQNGVYVVAVTNTATCTARDTVVLSLNSTTSVSITGLQSFYCINEPADSLTASVSGGIFTIDDTITATAFDPAVQGTGTFVVAYTYTNSYGCVSIDTANVIVSLCTGAGSPVEMQNHASISPNPGSGIFDLQVHSGIAQEASVAVYTILGDKVYNSGLSLTKGKQTLLLDLKHLPGGTYFIKLNGEHFTRTLRVSIIK